jgi:hypothetical protein
MNEDEKNPNENVERKNSKSEERNKNVSQEKIVEHPEPTNQTSEIPKSEIQNMEVHHHPDLHHKKKNFKEYFLEFLMIFLAVTLGFFAENIRENISEHSRAKVLAQSLFDDIKKDTAALNFSIQFTNRKLEAIDSLRYMLALSRSQWNDTVLYRNFGFITRLIPFERTSGTYDQIKSSGSLRYFDQSLVNLMNAYDVAAKRVLAREDIDEKITIEQFFPFLINDFNDITFDMSHEFSFASSTDSTSLKKLIKYAVAFENSRTRTLQEYDNLRSSAIDLLTALQKKYNLK